MPVRASASPAPFAATATAPRCWRAGTRARPMAQRILAIEVAGDSVRGALAERSWNSLAMIEVAEERRGPDETDLAPALARLLGGAAKPDLVLTALPGELVVKRMLALPFKDQRRLTQTVPFALEEHLPVGVDESVGPFPRVGREKDRPWGLLRVA